MTKTQKTYMQSLRNRYAELEDMHKDGWNATAAGMQMGLNEATTMLLVSLGVEDGWIHSQVFDYVTGAADELPNF